MTCSWWYFHAYSGWVPKSPPVENNKRVYWVDLMRIIGCIAVPIVHSINFTGTAGQPDPKHVCQQIGQEKMFTGRLVEFLPVLLGK